MNRLLSSNLNTEAKHIFAQKSAKNNLNFGLNSMRGSRKKQCRVCDLQSASRTGIKAGTASGICCIVRLSRM